ncbi:Gfo/Idh/MocA family oxidoreductase [Paenibacillus sp.]|jgi:predicted dehydrogenase|uniref:Gfo/Idh/MocA family protein n=1 Tax=Paenibacillus sp. TaxID=58172 RepID=UPI00282A099E|nr:Gfo/Idh/MocA family oxidoreductase [Paenibacillus sp.]MDR0270711.1 Gfo/Idh/MocA family oxidoreductase [Paenibacillus sp.]
MIRIGVVGAGIIAAEHMKHIHQNGHAELVAVCDVAPGAAESAVRQYGGTAYTSYDEMLKQEKLDALFICVPPFAHGEMEEKAAERGIHLLVEKPLGLNMEEVHRKAEVLTQSGIITGSGYCLRYIESVQRAKRYLQGKEIAMVRAYRFGSLPPNPWWVDHSKSGGQLVEQTTHNLDLMMYLAGDVRKVSADMALLLCRSVPGITTPDAASVNMVFDSGALGHIDTGFFPQPDGRASLEIMGRDFRLTLEGKDLTIMESEQTTIFRGKSDFYKSQDDAFIHAVETGDRSLILAPYCTAMRTLEVTLAANESAKTGQPVFFI